MKSIFVILAVLLMSACNQEVVEPTIKDYDFIHIEQLNDYTFASGNTYDYAVRFDVKPGEGRERVVLTAHRPNNSIHLGSMNVSNCKNHVVATTFFQAGDTVRVTVDSIWSESLILE